MGFKTPNITLVLVSMIVSGVRMFLKQMNETNNLIFFNFVYHENYLINILNEFGIKKIFWIS